jgi:hypothetical protein
LKGEEIMKLFKMLICVAVFVLAFGLGLLIPEIAKAEQVYTRTYYNNSVPYEQFVSGEHAPKTIKVQVNALQGQRKVQAVVPSNIVNDEKDDLTQKEQEKGQK